MKMEWNDTESKCVVHLAENFPENASRLDQEVMAEEEINVTSSFDKETKKQHIEPIKYVVDLKSYMIDVALDALRRDK